MEDLKRRTVIVLLVSIIFLTVFYLFQHSKTQKEKREEQASKLIPVSSEEDISEVIIERRRGGKQLWRLKLSRQGDKWLIVEPFKDVPKDYKVSSILQHLVDDKLEDIFEVSQSELYKYGFSDEDTLTEISVTSEDGDTYSFSIGGENELKHARYVRRDDEMKLGLLPTWKASYYDISSPKDMRLDRVVDIDILNVKRVEVSGEKTFALADENGVWWLQNGKEKVVASERKVKEFLADLNNLTVRQWIDSPESWMRANPILDVKLLMESEEGEKGKKAQRKTYQIKITVWNPKKDKYYVSTTERDPLLVVPRDKLFKLLEVNPQSFKSDKVFARVNFRKLKEVEISWKGKKARIVKGKEGWRWEPKSERRGDTFKLWLENVTFEREIPKERLSQEELYTKAELYTFKFSLDKGESITVKVRGLGDDLFVTEDGKVFRGLTDYLPWTKRVEKKSSEGEKKEAKPDD